MFCCSCMIFFPEDIQIQMIISGENENIKPAAFTKERVAVFHFKPIHCSAQLLPRLHLKCQHKT